MRLIATVKGCSDVLISIIRYRISTEGVILSKAERVHLFLISSVPLLALHVNKEMKLDGKRKRSNL